MAQRPQLTRGQWALVVIVVTGVGLIAVIGFVGSYTAVRNLAAREGFGWFSYALPVGIDAGISLFLALDLLLTWMRIPLPLLRHLAWLLTTATIVFNAASAWPRPLATAMHAIVPVLFIAAIEAARHAVGRITAVEAGQLMEGTRLGRWILAPVATFRLWRRRQLWELRSYQEALELERRRLVYRARLKAAYGRSWRRRAPVDQLLLLKLANLGEPLPQFRLNVQDNPVANGGVPVPQGVTERPDLERPPLQSSAMLVPAPRDGATAVVSLPTAVLPDHAAVDASDTEEPAGQVAVGPSAAQPPVIEVESPLDSGQDQAVTQRPVAGVGTAVDRYYQAFASYRKQHDAFPDGEQLAQWLWHEFGVKGRSGVPLTAGHLRRYLRDFRERWQTEEQEDHTFA